MGPIVKPPVKAGQRAWVVIPVSGAWDAVKIALLPVLEVSATDVLVDRDGRKMRIPGAFVAAAAAAPRLAKADPVMASARGTRVFARVVEVKPDAVAVRFKFAGTVEQVELPLDEVVLIDGRPVLGAPVLVRDPDATRIGHLLHQSPGKTWVAQAGGRPRWLPPANVDVLPAPPTLAVGDSVLAPRGDELEPATVTAVRDDGLLLDVKWTGREDTATHTFEAITRRKK